MNGTDGMDYGCQRIWNDADQSDRIRLRLLQGQRIDSQGAAEADLGLSSVRVALI